MIHANSLTVTHKKNSSHSGHIGYVFKSEKGKIIYGVLDGYGELNVGDVLKHDTGDAWTTPDGSELDFGKELVETTEAEALRRLEKG